MAFLILSAFLASQILILLVGYGVACAARHRPRVTNAIIGLAVVGGFGLIWCGGEMSSMGPRMGAWLLAGGLALVFVGVPTCALIPAAREANNRPGWAGWARLLATYLAACWVFMLFLGLPVAIFVQLATAPAGSFR